MKKAYFGLKAEKIDFGSFNMVAFGSLPPGCIQIVADVVDPGDNVCKNPYSTTQYMYLFDHPFFPDD